MYSLIIFDLDGTLLYTLEDLTDSVNFALLKNNMPPQNIKDIQKYVGNGVDKLIERVVPDGKNNPLYETVLNNFKTHYQNNSTNNTKIYSGIDNVLIELKNRGYKTAILSNKFDSAVKNLANFYFKNNIDYALGVTDNILPKPSVTGVKFLLNKFNTDKENCLIIGDSETDILTAKNAKIDFISVCWGYRNKNYLINNGADKLIDTPYELLNIL